MADTAEHFSRRTLLAGLGGTAAAGLVALPGAARAKPAVVNAVAPASGAVSRKVALASAAYSDWSAQIGSYFTLETGHVLQLVDVQSAPFHDIRPAGVRPLGFVASFDIVRGGTLADGRYLTAHPAGGTFEMFLTRGKPATRMLAVFN